MSTENLSLSDFFNKIADGIANGTGLRIEDAINKLYSSGVKHAELISDKWEAPYGTSDYSTSPRKRKNNSSTTKNKMKKTITDDSESEIGSKLDAAQSNKKLVGIYSSKSNPKKYVAELQLYKRKVNLGEFLSETEAAQAHDRAMIRSLGPSKCNQQMLNFEITFYARDSLNLFTKFDTTLKKGFFGTNWPGLRGCDFGSLAISLEHSQGKMKRKIDKTENDNQPRKRISGQKKNRRNQTDDDDVDEEEPYFKIPGSHFKNPGSKIFKTTKPAKFNQCKVGDVVIVMHGLKERKAGLESIQRAIVLEKRANGGWIRIGFKSGKKDDNNLINTDNTGKIMNATTCPAGSMLYIRGKFIDELQSCEYGTKILKVPSEAVTNEDLALWNSFRDAGYGEPIDRSSGVSINEQTCTDFKGRVGNNVIESSKLIEEKKEIEGINGLKLPAVNTENDSDVIKKIQINNSEPGKLLEVDIKEKKNETIDLAMEEKEIKKISVKQLENSVKSCFDDILYPIPLSVLLHYTLSLNEVTASSDSGAKEGLERRRRTTQDGGVKVFSPSTYSHKTQEIPSIACFVLAQELNVLFDLLAKKDVEEEVEINNCVEVESSSTSLEDEVLKKSIEKQNDQLEFKSNTSLDISTTEPTNVEAAFKLVDTLPKKVEVEFKSVSETRTVSVNHLSGYGLDDDGDDDNDEFFDGKSIKIYEKLLSEEAAPPSPRGTELKSIPTVPVTRDSPSEKLKESFINTMMNRVSLPSTLSPKETSPQPSAQSHPKKKLKFSCDQQNSSLQIDNEVLIDERNKNEKNYVEVKDMGKSGKVINISDKSKNEINNDSGKQESKNIDIKPTKQGKEKKKEDEPWFCSIFDKDSTFELKEFDSRPSILLNLRKELLENLSYRILQHIIEKEKKGQILSPENVTDTTEKLLPLNGSFTGIFTTSNITQKRFFFEIPEQKSSVSIAVPISDPVMGHKFGFFSSPLEAAMLRHQILGGNNKPHNQLTQTGNALEKSDFDFNQEEWSCLVKLGKIVNKFIKTNCVN